MPPDPDTTTGLRLLSREAGAPAVDLGSLVLPLLVLDNVREDFARQYRVLPLRVDATHLFVAMADPNDEAVKAELAFLTGRTIVAYAAPAPALERAIAEVYGARLRGDIEWRGGRARAAASGAGAPTGAGVGSARAGAEARRPAAAEASGVPLRQAEPAIAAPPVREPFAGEVPFEPIGDDRGPAASRRTRVLVVDDEPVIRRIVRQALAVRGYEVLEAETGATALQAIKNNEPDVILLDAMLPDIHGFDICKRLKESRRYAHIPVIMMTAVYKGWRMEADIREAYGVVGYIEKPFDIHEVVSQIVAALAGRPADARPDAVAVSTEAQKLYDAAAVAYQRGDFDGAVGALTAAVAIDPLNATLRHQLGLVQARRGLDFAAIQELEVAVDLEPNRFASLRNLAVLYQRRGFRRKACEVWERALAVAPDEPTRQEIKTLLVSLL